MGHPVRVNRVLGLNLTYVGGLVKLVPAVAYNFCLNLPASFSQPRASHLQAPSISVPIMLQASSSFQIDLGCAVMITGVKLRNSGSVSGPGVGPAREDNIFMKIIVL